eukprot:CAMPEP_0206628506 /NCGR_PEP_ID=MMETSP0325_2-20121206/66551_1 /ASSEMBLY_ACC=CAM_ASM_000347 /TAXON_ID=2866 /ORGANISM="Crypthecodinium cohnii, Strain Seligo" /LENGTH=230 /DNA_ID=CAMNT_0054153253 /DNA_START=137 /DNA_END=829 /DNA_ORIENTATION=-
MVAKNLTEYLGFKPSAYKHWDPNPVVGLSSLCFAVPSCAFAAVVLAMTNSLQKPYPADLLFQLLFYALLCFQYAVAVIFCCLADYVYIRRGHRSFFGKVDIIWASFTFFASNVNFALRAGLIEPAVCSSIAILAFMYSGSSKSFQQWIFRHSFWHFIGGSIGTYGALRFAPMEGLLWPVMLDWLVHMLTATAAMVLALLCAATSMAEHGVGVWRCPCSVEGSGHMKPGRV